MLGHVQLESLVTGQLFGTNGALKPKVGLMLVDSMASQHTSGRKFLLAHIAFEYTIGLVLHIGVNIVEMSPYGERGYPGGGRGTAGHSATETPILVFLPHGLECWRGYAITFGQVSL